MMSADTVPLRYGLVARYVLRAEIVAAQKCAQSRETPADNQLRLDEEHDDA
jgi:hypothetical protein